MKNDIKTHIKTIRFKSLPESMCREIKAARLKKGLSQAELGLKVGLPQMHISRIETGKIVPRFNTLLEIVRVLEFDLLLIPRPLVPMVQSLTRKHSDTTEERSLYADDEGDIEEKRSEF